MSFVRFVLGTNMDGDFGIVTLQQQPAQELPDIAQFLSVYMAEDDPMIVHGRLPEGAVHHSVPHSVFSNGTMETQQQHHVHHRPDGATVTSSHGTIVLNPVVIKGQQEQVLNHGIRSSLALLPATKGPNEGTSSSTSKKTPAGGADGKKHVCTTCNKQFSRSDKLTLHRRTHTGERPYVCFCGKRFTRSDHLKIHALKHKMDAELRQVMLREAKGTDGATNSVTMEPTAISSLCVKVENDNQYGGSSNGASESGNAGEQRQECHVCQKVFGSIYKLGRHLRTHTGEKPYMCFCGDKFSRSDALRTHQRSKHTPSFIGEGGAGVMTQGGTGLGNLVQVKCEPGVQGGQQLVLVSSAQPTQPHQMLQQQLPQTGIAGVERERGEKPPSKKKPPAADGFFPCDYCSKTFNAGYKLTVHLRYHTGEKPYACDTCGKAFARRDHMKKHRKIHFK